MTSLNLGTVTAKLIVDSSGFTKGVNNAKGTMNAFLKAFTAVTVIKKFGEMTAATVKVFADFEQSMSAVKAVTGATVSEFRKLENAAKDLGASTVFTASEVAKTQVILAKSGQSVNAILDLTPAILDGAAASGKSLGDVTKTLTSVMASMQIETGKANKIINGLTKAALSSKSEVTDYGTAMAYVGSVAQTAGISFSETSAALSLLMQAGFQASSGAAALRNILIRSTKASGAAADALRELGIQSNTVANEGFLGVVDAVEKASTSMSKTRYMATLAQAFGARAGPALAALVNQGTDALRTQADAIENVGDIAKDVAQVQIDNLAGKFKILKSATEGLQIAIGGALSPSLTKLAEVLTVAAQGWTEYYDAMMGPGIPESGSIGVQQMLDENEQQIKSLTKKMSVTQGYMDNLNLSPRQQQTMGTRLVSDQAELVKLLQQRTTLQNTMNRLMEEEQQAAKDSRSGSVVAPKTREAPLRAALRVQENVLREEKRINEESHRNRMAFTKELVDVYDSEVDRLRTGIVDSFRTGVSILVDGGRTLFIDQMKKAGENLASLMSDTIKFTVSSPEMQAAGAALGFTGSMAVGLPPEVGGMIGEAFGQLASQSVALSAVFSGLSNAINSIIMPIVELAAVTAIISTPMLQAVASLAVLGTALDIILAPISLLTDLFGEFFTVGGQYLKTLYMLWFFTQPVGKELAKFADMLAYVTDLMRLSVDENQRKLPGKKDSFAAMLSKLQDKIDDSMGNFTNSTDKATKSVQKLNDELVNLNTSFRLRRRIADAVADSQFGAGGMSVNFRPRQMALGDQTAHLQSRRM